MAQASPSFFPSQVFQQIQACNEASVRDTGDIDVQAVADILDAALTARRAPMILALADFVARSLSGCVPDPDSL